MMLYRHRYKNYTDHANCMICIKTATMKSDIYKILISSDLHQQQVAYSVIAITRSGLPEPLTILRGAATTIAPVGGSWSRFIRLVMPNLPAPCINVWLGKGGLKPPACPASVPTVSTPTHRILRSVARNCEHSF